MSEFDRRVSEYLANPPKRTAWQKIKYGFDELLGRHRRHNKWCKEYRKALSEWAKGEL